MGNRRKVWTRGFVLAAVAVGAVAVADWWRAGSAGVVRAQPLAASATHSSPIALTTDNAFVWSVNPDNNSVSVFNVAGDANTKLAEIAVGREPWCVAVVPSGEKVYVTNMVSGTVSVIEAATRQVFKTIRVGTEPFGCALTPDGRRLYVANQSSNTVSVIDTAKNAVIRTIGRVGEKPHAIAITADGKKVYVTQFLALRRTEDPRRPLTRSEGADDGREGRVTVIDAVTNRVINTVILNPLPNVGNAFRSDGSTLGREPVTGVFDNITGAFPNLLESVVIRGSLAYVSGTCSSPNGPFRFNVNVQSCLSTIDIAADVEAFPTLNMNDGVQNELPGTRLFNTNPFMVAFKHASAEGFVALGATDRLLRITLDAQGRGSINAPPAPLNPGDPSPIVRIELKDPMEIGQPDPNYTIGGRNPRAVVINSSDTRAYVMDFLSRDVAVVDVSGTDPLQYKTLARIGSSSLPTSGDDVIVQRGKVLFNSSIGPEGTQANSMRPAGLLSDFGWGTCYSCHPQALTDSVTWMFADGPRQAISMEKTFEFGAAVIENGAPKLPESHQRALNWSAVRDEVQDFTRNIRAVSGGGGLVKFRNGTPVPEGVAGLALLPDLIPVANSNLSADLDAIATYLAKGVRAPIAPVSDEVVATGRKLFQAAGCQNCHGGKNWTISVIDYTPPPNATEIVDAQLIRFLCRAGTFNAEFFSDGVSNEIRANNVANVQARGNDGFTVPSLIATFADAPYLHSGTAPTLDAVLENVTHRSAGSGGVDMLASRADRREVVRFLKSIDRDTAPFLNVSPPTGICGPPQP
jgi:YVTN family beta-propeller protein